VPGSGFRVARFGFRVGWVAGYKLQGYRVQGAGFGVAGRRMQVAGYRPDGKDVKGSWRTR